MWQWKKSNKDKTPADIGLETSAIRPQKSDRDPSWPPSEAVTLNHWCLTKALIDLRCRRQRLSLHDMRSTLPVDRNIRTILSGHDIWSCPRYLCDHLLVRRYHVSTLVTRQKDTVSFRVVDFCREFMPPMHSMSCQSRTKIYEEEKKIHWNRTSWKIELPLLHSNCMRRISRTWVAFSSNQAFQFPFYDQVWSPPTTQIPTPLILQKWQTTT